MYEKGHVHLEVSSGTSPGEVKLDVSFRLADGTIVDTQASVTATVGTTLDYGDLYALCDLQPLTLGAGVPAAGVRAAAKAGTPVAPPTRR